MISRDELQKLMGRQARQGTNVLSVYLNFDSYKDDPLIREFETAFKALRHDKKRFLAEEEVPEFERDCEVVRKFLADYKPKMRGGVFFSDASEGFFWMRPVKVLVADQLYWKPAPFVLPLIETWDEYERVGVVVCDREKARIFTAACGEIEEEEDMIASNDVHHFKSTGRDNIRSVTQLERTEELHVAWHLKHAVDAIEKASRVRNFDRLILGGLPKLRHKLYRMLPADLKAKVSGQFSLAFQSPDSKIVDAVLHVEEKMERDGEGKLVERLVTLARKRQGAVVGLQSVARCLKQGGIFQLVYSANFMKAGSRCAGCGRSFRLKRQICTLCGGASEPVEDLVEGMARRIIFKNGRVEEVKGEAARELDEEGGIGAFLRQKRH